MFKLLDYHIADNAETPFVSIVDVETGNDLIQFPAEESIINLVITLVQANNDAR